MITEKGTVKTEVTHSENLYNELNRSVRNLGILYVVCGAIIFVLGTVLFGISAFEGTDDGNNTILIVAGLAFSAFGVIFLATCRSSAKTALKFKRVEEVEFFADHLIAKEYTDGEHTATNKVYYTWIIRVKETKNYLFLYNTRVTAIAVDKNSLPPDELNAIRSLLGRAAQPAPVQPAPAPTEVPPTEVPPTDPFQDMKENQDNKEE